MTNYQPQRMTAPQKARLHRRAEKALERWKRRRCARFRKIMLDRARYWAARRKMQQDRSMTLQQGFITVFLDELRAA